MMEKTTFDIDSYCRELRELLLKEFGGRLCYIGLQGSYMRGEATDRSDIDIMVILDRLTAADMDLYRALLARVGDDDRACGFICGRDEMKNWNPLEMCNLAHTTKDLHGRLTDFLPEWTREDEVNYVKMSLDNLYHALCHGYIHADRGEMAESLVPLYKSAFFILQNTHYLETGEFAVTKAELLRGLRGADREVLARLMSPGEGGDFQRDFGLIFTWCRDKMAEAF